MPCFGLHSPGNEVVDVFRSQVQGKTMLITGASIGGLGAETAITLARAHPARLILLARSAKKVQPVIDQIHDINPDIEAIFVAIELDKSTSVRAAADQTNEKASQSDMLINNAGIMAVPYSQNDAGIESQLATNHVGHFLLTNLLINKIKAARKGARNINITSDGYLISAFNFDDYNFSDGKTYDEWSGYGQSKTANILFTKYLAKHLAKDGIEAFAVHSGVILDTSLSNGMEDMSLFDKIPAIAERNTGHKFAMAQPKTIQEGISTTLVAGLDPRPSKESGALLFDCKTVEPKEYASSEQHTEQVWQLSEKLVKQDFIL